MLYKIKDRHLELCVLQIDTKVLDVAGVVITDRNASSDWVRYAASPHGVQIVDRDQVFAEYWTHPENQVMEWVHKSIKCAEVLVPDVVDNRYITGGYASCQEVCRTIEEMAIPLEMTIHAHLFFR